MTNDSKFIFEAYDKTDAQHPLAPQIRRSAAEEYDLDEPTDDEKQELGFNVARPTHHTDQGDVSYEEEEEKKVNEGQIEITETNFNDVIRNAYDAVVSRHPRVTTTVVGGSSVRWVSAYSVYVSVNPEDYKSNKTSQRVAASAYKYYKRFKSSVDASSFYEFVIDAIHEYKGNEMEGHLKSSQDKFNQAYQKDAAERLQRREAIAREAALVKAQVTRDDFN